MLHHVGVMSVEVSLSGIIIIECGGSSVDDYFCIAVCFSQRSLAEIVEMIHTAGLIHKGIVNISSLVDDSSSAVTAAEPNSQTDDFELGNKMAVLSGDFLLASASTGLAALNNTKVHGTSHSGY